MLRIDTHHHLIPPDYHNALRKAGIDEAGGRVLPDWTPEATLQTMADYTAGLVASQPDRFGFFAASASTPHCHPAPPRYPRCSLSLNPGTLRSDPTGHTLSRNVMRAVARLMSAS
jgi:hypothetical protein